MDKALLDTDILSEILKGINQRVKLKATAYRAVFGYYTTSVITVMEVVHDPKLLRLALSHVAKALGEQKMTQEQAKIHLEKLDELLSQRGGKAIYNIGSWLNALGLKLTVTVT